MSERDPMNMSGTPCDWRPAKQETAEQRVANSAVSGDLNTSDSGRCHPISFSLLSLFINRFHLSSWTIQPSSLLPQPQPWQHLVNNSTISQQQPNNTFQDSQTDNSLPFNLPYRQNQHHSPPARYIKHGSRGNAVSSQRAGDREVCS